MFTTEDVILVDTSEGAPYNFYKPGMLPKCKRVKLKTGDYTIEGCEDRITIERKELSDFYKTIHSKRQRFRRQLQRMSNMISAHIVLEATFDEMCTRIPVGCNMTPTAILRTLTGFWHDYGVPTWFAGDRGGGEELTYRILENFLKENK